jgi:hypothetical protein
MNGMGNGMEVMSFIIGSRKQKAENAERKRKRKRSSSHQQLVFSLLLGDA